MKTLDQVEPRTPISTAGFTITQPGSYYLTTNLAATGHGVVIAASGVTLDLMGFALTGNRTGNRYGVYLSGASSMPVCDVAVRNGVVRNFHYGVHAEYSQGCWVEQLLVSSNAANGVVFDGKSGVCSGNTLSACVIRGNGTSGVLLNVSTGGRCEGNTVVGCSILDNGAYGVYLNGLFGSCEGNTISGCTVNKNNIRGIWLSSTKNCRVDNNHVFGQVGASTTGIDSSSSGGNMILRNTCVGQTNNFTFGAADTFGPVVTASGALSTTNGAAGLSPWANFSR
jgi:parallel beta-helix repeat protein